MVEARAEEKGSPVKETVKGWVKGILTSIFGVVSGVFLMYLTPLINNSIKPARPIANFSTQTNGLSVTFFNAATGTEGWWDFGDGSALEPFVPKLPSVSHTYQKASSYNVKLSVQNLIGEENDRTVSVNLDNTVGASKPEIQLFDLNPVRGERAPAVYHLQSRVKNAACGLIHLGDDRPLEVVPDPSAHERYVTFEKPGTYTIRLAALSGKDIIEKTRVIHVTEGSPGLGIMAKLSVNYQTVKVDKAVRTYHISCPWQVDGNQTVSPIHAQRHAAPGFLFTGAEILNKDEKGAPVRNLKLDISADKKAFVLSGELVKSTSFFKPKAAPSWQAEVKVTMEKRAAPASFNCGDLMMEVALNTTTRIPLQPLEAGMELVSKKMKLQLWEGRKLVWESSKAEAKVPVTLSSQPCYVSVIPQLDGIQLKIDSSATSPGLSSVGATILPVGAQELQRSLETPELKPVPPEDVLEAFPPPPRPVPLPTPVKAKKPASNTVEKGPVVTAPPAAAAPPSVPYFLRPITSQRLPGLPRAAGN